MALCKMLCCCVAVRATVHVSGCGASGHRLPRGAGSERSPAVPGSGRAAGRAGIRAGQAGHPAHALQARRAGKHADTHSTR